MTKHQPKPGWRRRVYLTLGTNLSLKDGRAETKSETVKIAAYWLAPELIFRFLSNKTQVQQPRGSTTHSGLVPPTSVNNQENAPINLSTLQSMEATPQLRFPLPMFIKLTTKISCHNRDSN